MGRQISGTPRSPPTLPRSRRIAQADTALVDRLALIELAEHFVPIGRILKCGIEGMVQQFRLTRRRMPPRGVPVVGVGVIEPALLKRELVAVAQKVDASGVREPREMTGFRFRMVLIGKGPESLLAARLAVPHAVEFNHQHVHEAPLAMQASQSSKRAIMKPKLPRRFLICVNRDLTLRRRSKAIDHEISQNFLPAAG